MIRPALALTAAAALAWFTAGALAGAPGPTGQAHAVRAAERAAPALRGIPSYPESPDNSLVFFLPFAEGESWYYSGGPHGTAAANDNGLHALDFWPGSRPGCGDTVAETVRAIAPGAIDALGDGWVSQDVGPGAGYHVNYYHVLPAPGIVVSATVQTGDPIGHPACVGLAHGTAAHLHLGVRRGAEWIVPELGGWTFEPGTAHYTGWATGPNGERRCPSSQHAPGQCESGIP